MKLSVLLVLVLSIAASETLAVTNAFDVRRLQVRWEVVENSHNNKSQFLSAFTFTNTGNVALPASGWSLYFNFVRRILSAPASGGVMMGHTNGDLYRLHPQAGFKGLAAGASLRVEFVAVV
jgi:hexosaminidase